ncbi:MAG: glyoxalase [Ktedonobacterales bacterium]|nr:glyoxalase [Ktedonobacterales bacterium]
MSKVATTANPEGHGGVWFTCGAQQIHISIVTEGFVPRRKGHPTLEVRDLAGWRSKLAAANVAITEDEPLPGWSRCSIADPEGNRIERIERVTHPRTAGA